jgi:hypothetical protein
MLHYTSALAGFGWVYLVEYLPHRVLSIMRPAQMQSLRTRR